MQKPSISNKIHVVDACRCPGRPQLGKSADLLIAGTLVAAVGPWQAGVPLRVRPRFRQRSSGSGARLCALVCGRERPVGPVDPVVHTSGEGSFLVRG